MRECSIAGYRGNGDCMEQRCMKIETGEVGYLMRIRSKNIYPRESFSFSLSLQSCMNTENEDT